MLVESTIIASSEAFKGAIFLSWSCLSLTTKSPAIVL